MIGVVEAFSQKYSEARRKFLEATASAGLAVTSHKHPLPGIEGEDLALDVALDGDLAAGKLLIVSSGCHGVEGYCGSGVQVFALHDAEWRETARSQGIAVLYLHALNPYGFSFCSRTTHENVDLNRNFSDYSQPRQPNLAYRDVHAMLVPEQWPPDPENMTQIQAYIQAKGIKGFQAAVSGGQNEYPDGLFYAGAGPTWSNLTLRSVLKHYAANVKNLAWIDLHTGLGPPGIGERIFAGPNDPVAYQRTVAWWSGGGSTPVTSTYQGTSASASLTGQMFYGVLEEMPQSQYTGIAMEYGTVPIMETMQALRADQWVRRHPEAPAGKAASLRRQVRDAFYTDTDLWKGQIISQARQAMFQAADGLAS